jgi:putative membrane protein
MFKTITAAAALAFVFSTPASSADKPKLNDAQIAAIAYTAGEIDVNAGKQALEKSKNPDVRMFAQEMIADHTAVNDKASALLKKLNVTPEPTDTSKSLSDAAKKKLAEFAKLNGAAFDRDYVNNEVAFHKTVNDALRSTLIPDASNPELKGLLETGLKLFEQHQMHAEHLAGELAAKNVQARK